MTMTVIEFMKRFPNDDACLEHLMAKRHGFRRTCEGCGKPSIFHRVRTRKVYNCQWCGYQISPCVGTPMEKSRTPLVSWFYAIYLFTASRHGVSAKEIQRSIGVTYKCAWRMAHEIRKYMAQVDGDGMLDGHVELDEAYVGGRKRGGKKLGLTGRGADKAIVFGMVERGGEVITRVVETASRRDMLPHVRRHVEPGTHISTDEYMPYRALPKMGYSHGMVKHRAKQYVSGIDHVNNIEAFWLILKRSIRGTHVWVSPKHLASYLGEFEFRWNRRKQPERMLADLLAFRT